MSSSRYYKLWLRNSGTASWVEVTKFMNMTFGDTINGAPNISVTVYTKDSTTRSLIKANNIYRVTKLDSTTGDNGTHIQTGTLGEPTSDEKSTPPGGNPVVYSLVGNGFASNVGKMVYEPTTDPPPTLSGTMSSVVTSIISNVNTRAAGTLATGTLDTGPTITYKAKGEDVYDALRDIASVGDATNKFSYYVIIDNDASYVPRINVLSPVNSTYTLPNGNIGFLTTNPITAGDNDRIIEKDTETRQVHIIKENDRIRNAVRVRYKGMGTGDESTTTAFTTDATSITSFGRRETTVYAPWVQDVTTATLLRNTILDTFKGASDGLIRVEIELKSGELYNTGTFDANLGDVITLRDDSTEVATGKFLSYKYNQSTESLLVVIGLPRVQSQEAVAIANRLARRTYNSADLTKTQLSIEEAQRVAGGAVSNFNALSNDHTNSSMDSTLVDTAAIVAPNGLGEASGYLVELSILPAALYPSVLGTTRSIFDGAVTIELELQSSPSADTATVLKHTFVGPMIVGESYTVRNFYPFSVTTTDSDLSIIRMTSTTVGTAQSGQSIDINADVNITPVPLVTLDLSHEHRF